MLGAAVVAYSAGRTVASTGRGPTTAVAAIAGGTALWVLLTPDGLSGQALAGPLGYGNANGALCTLGTGAAGVLALATGDRLVRTGAVLLSAVLSVLALQTGSAAAAALSAALVALMLLLLGRPGWAPAVPVLCVAAVAGTALLTVALALGVQGSAQPVVVEALSARRTQLWSDALDIVRAAPLTGVGAGAFSTTSPTALADADTRTAHSAWLQQAAETGAFSGGVLLAAGLLAVSAGRSRSAVAGFGGAVVGAVLVQAGIDDVLRYPVILLLTAMVCGLTVTRPAPSPVSPLNR